MTSTNKEKSMKNLVLDAIAELNVSLAQTQATNDVLIQCLIKDLLIAETGDHNQSELSE